MPRANGQTRMENDSDDPSEQQLDVKYKMQSYQRVYIISPVVLHVVASFGEE